MAVGQSSMHPYPVAVVYSFLSLLAVLVTIVPIACQIRHRNVAGFSLMLWLGIFNFMGFLNGIIWSHDNMSHWYFGNVLCDIEVRAHLAAVLGVEMSLVLIFKGLANVLDSNISVIANPLGPKKSKIIIECLLCFGTPGLYIILYYIVQPGRYDIYGISGCQYLIEGSWVSIVLVSMWPLALNVISAGFASLTIFRLYRYSRSFQALIASHNSTRARFIRLFIAGLVMVLAHLPVSTLAFMLNFPLSPEPYSWNATHDPSEWSIVEIHRSHGKILPEFWGGIVGGFIIGLTLGTGAEASQQYKKFLTAIGLAKIFPSLLRHNIAHGSSSSSGKWSLLSGKAVSIWTKFRRANKSTNQSTTTYDVSSIPASDIEMAHMTNSIHSSVTVGVEAHSPGLVSALAPHIDIEAQSPFVSGQTLLTRNWDLMYKDIFNPNSHLNS